MGYLLLQKSYYSIVFIIKRVAIVQNKVTDNIFLRMTICTMEGRSELWMLNVNLRILKVYKYLGIHNEWRTIVLNCYAKKNCKHKHIYSDVFICKYLIQGCKYMGEEFTLLRKWYDSLFFPCGLRKTFKVVAMDCV